MPSWPCIESLQGGARPRCRGTAAARRGRRRSRPRSRARRRCRRTRLPMTPRRRRPATAAAARAGGWCRSRARGGDRRGTRGDAPASDPVAIRIVSAAQVDLVVAGGVVMRRDGGDRRARGRRRGGGLGHDADRVRDRGTRRCRGTGRRRCRDKPALDPLALIRGDPALVEHELGDGGLAAEREVHAVEVARLEPRDRQRRLAQGLAGQGAGVRRGAADHRALLDDRRPLAQDGRRRTGALARRPRTDDDQVI